EDGRVAEPRPSRTTAGAGQARGKRRARGAVAGAAARDRRRGRAHDLRQGRPTRRLTSAWPAHPVDADRAGEEERIVLPRCDLDPICVAHPEPALRHLRDLVAVTLELVLVVDDVALRLEVSSARDVDRVALAQRCNQRFLDRRDSLPAVLDGHLVANAELLLLNREELLP